MYSREEKGKGVCLNSDVPRPSIRTGGVLRIDADAELRRRESTATRDPISAEPTRFAVPEPVAPAAGSENSGYRDYIPSDDPDVDTETDVDEMEETVADEFLPPLVELKMSTKDLVEDGRSWMDAKRLAELTKACDFPEGLILRLPRSNERVWDVPDGFICVYECFFTVCGLRFPIPQLLLDFCQNHKVAVGQLSHSVIRHMVCCTAVARSMNIDFNCDFFERISSLKTSQGGVLRAPSYFYTVMKKSIVAGYSISKLRHWDRFYFFVKIDNTSAPGNDAVIFTTWRSKPGRILCRDELASIFIPTF